MGTSDGSPVLRDLAAGDASTIAALSRAARFDAIPGYPDLHTPAEDVAFYASEIASSSGLAAAAGDGQVVGFILWREPMVTHLYVDIRHQRTGIGSALLDAAVERMSTRPLRLWTFESNDRAVAFYPRRGWVVAERTDGRSNEERLPDILFELR